MYISTARMESSVKKPQSTAKWNATYSTCGSSRHRETKSHTGERELMSVMKGSPITRESIHPGYPLTGKCINVIHACAHTYT